MEKIVYFTNPLKEDFTFRWDKIPYTVRAGETMQFPDFLATHGAKHLVNHIILHPELWKELGLVRVDNGDRRNADGIVINEPDITKGRDEILKLILGVEKAISSAPKKSDGDKVKEQVDALNKEDEFKDLENLKN